MTEQNQQKYCTGCGTDLRTSDRFCRKCGKSVSKPTVYPPHPAFYSASKQGMPYRSGSKTDVYCIAGIVLSGYAIFSYIIAPVFSIAGIIVSAIGMKRVTDSGADGRNLALAGIIIGALGLIVYAILVLLFSDSGGFREWIPFRTIDV